MEARGQGMPPLGVGRIWRDPNQIAPQPRRIPSVQLPARATMQTYANECIITRGDHDAVMRFYIVREGAKSLVAEITVPLSVLPQS